MQGYIWEKSVSVVPDVALDEHGSIIPIATEPDAVRKRRLQDGGVGESIRRGVIRYLYILVDWSVAMDEDDFRPTRGEVVYKALTEFIEDFFDQNPLSQLGIIITRRAVAEKISEMSGNKTAHLEALAAKLLLPTGACDTEGDMSLQLGLQMALQSFTHAAPSFATKQLLLIHASLRTIDRFDVFATIEELKEKKVKCSVISMVGEMNVAVTVATTTGGTFACVSSEPELSHQLSCITVPPPVLTDKKTGGAPLAEMVQWGFPRVADTPSVCACHIQDCEKGYDCPRCASRLCERNPSTSCPVCGIRLAAPSHLARSYHHLFPVPVFVLRDGTGAVVGPPRAGESVAAGEGQESKGEDVGEGERWEAPVTDAPELSKYCFACLSKFGGGDYRLQCPKCDKQFCTDCDALIHDSLHNCPGCC